MGKGIEHKMATEGIFSVVELLCDVGMVETWLNMSKPMLSIIYLSVYLSGMFKVIFIKSLSLKFF